MMVNHRPYFSALCDSTHVVCMINGILPLIFPSCFFVRRLIRMPASCCFDGGPAALWARPRCSVTSALFYRRRELTCAGLLPWAGMMLLVLTQIFLLLFTESAELKLFYLKDTTVVIEMSLCYNISVAILCYTRVSRQRAVEKSCWNSSSVF